MESHYFIIDCFLSTATFLLKLPQNVDISSWHPRRNINTTTFEFNLTAPTAMDTNASRKVIQPLILIYKTHYSSKRFWVPVRDSNVVFTPKDCPTLCDFAFDRYFQKSAHLVLVHISGFRKYAVGKRP